MTTCSRRGFLRTLAGGMAGLSSHVASKALGAAAPAKRKPNIVFFLVDDMGWMDTTVNGSRYYETPNMERLAKQSMVFTNAYAANPLCSPTRASILTGKYPARLGFTTPGGHLPPLPPGTPLLPDKAPPSQKMILPISRRHLPPEEYTIAEALRDAGYRTGHFGKWHLGLNPEHWPNRQGFDVKFHGAPDPGPPSYHSPYGFKAGNATDGPEGEYIADRLTDEAIRFIEADRDKPFLLHLWHYSVHGPWGHKEEITKRFARKKDPRGKQANPIMASMLKSMDDSLGRILDKLDTLKLTDNTVFIVFSDNGGNVHSNTDTDGKAAKIKEGHPKWPMIRSWRKYAGVQAPTNNAPLRGGKAMIYEGGVRVPMMVRWPGMVKAGSKCSELVSSIDFYPTMLAAAGAAPRKDHLVDGESLLPLLKQTDGWRREAIFCHFPHGMGDRAPASTSVRKGDWKLIRVYVTGAKFSDPFELYNLADDIGETTNLAAKHPEKVRELDALIERFLKDTGAVVPKPNPAYQPPAPTLGGWQPKVDGAAAIKDGALHVDSKTRPNLVTKDVPGAKGTLIVTLRMRSTGGQNAVVYWATPRERNFARERRVEINPPHDGEWHEHEAKFTIAAPLTGLRFDPSLIGCKAEIDWIRLCRQDGSVLKAWEFAK